MAQVKLKYSSVASKVPTVQDLVYGELAINITDGKIYYKNNTNQIASFSSNNLELFSVYDNGGDGNLTYNNTTGVFTYTGPSATETRAHFTAGTGISIVNGQISSTITQWTASLTRSSISVSGGLTYDNATGIISSPTLATVATSGSYTDLSNTPSIPSVFDDLADVTITTPAVGNILKYNGTAWVNQAPDVGLSRSDFSAYQTGGDGTLVYDNTTGVFTYTGPGNTQYRAAFSAGTGITISDGEISTTITQYTNANARTAFSASSSGDGSLTYNNTTGVFTYAGPGNTQYRAAFSAGTGITITSGVVATTITQYTDGKTSPR